MGTRILISNECLWPSASIAFDLETIVGRRSFLIKLIKASTHEEWRHSKYYVRIKSTVKIVSTRFEYSGRGLYNTLENSTSVNHQIPDVRFLTVKFFPESIWRKIQILNHQTLRKSPPGGAFFKFCKFSWNSADSSNQNKNKNTASYSHTQRSLVCQFSAIVT